jgi:hypothetical protein
MQRMVNDPGVTQTISDRQWQAYIQVCYQRDLLTDALRLIASGSVATIEGQREIARLALGVEG